MLKEFVEKIADMAENKTHQINGEFYSDKPTYHIKREKYAPSIARFNSLEALVKMIKTEILKQRALPVIVDVSDHDFVRVFTTYDDDYDRDCLYESKADVPYIGCIGNYYEHEGAMIMLKSLFKETPDLEYTLNLLTKITDDSSVSSSDNGLTQTVEAKKGISLLVHVEVSPRETLKPNRTFLEVDHPDSEFLLRVSEGGKIALFEADGGMWKILAKRNVKEYFLFELAELIESGDVVVTA